MVAARKKEATVGAMSSLDGSEVVGTTGVEGDGAAVAGEASTDGDGAVRACEGAGVSMPGACTRMSACCSAVGCKELQMWAGAAEEAAEGSAVVSSMRESVEKMDGGGGAVLACVPVAKMVCGSLEAAWDAKLQVGARMADEAAGGGADESADEEEADTVGGEGGAEPG